MTTNSAAYNRQWRAKQRGAEDWRRPHGTMAAYRRHQRHGEPPCQACKKANAEYQRNYHQRRKNPCLGSSATAPSDRQTS